jgi:lipopolysaccharide cholinephosphotransferase
MSNIRDMQEKEIAMMAVMDALFKVHDINYWLLGGSVLGSIRHQGFIPWDDDIDVGIMRNDFFRAESLLASLEGYVYEPVEKPVVVPNPPIGHLHYTDDNYSIQNSPTIDIFALDGVPNDVVSQRRQRFWADIYLFTIYGQKAENRGMFIRLITSFLLIVLPGVMALFLKKTAFRFMTKYNCDTAPRIGNLFGAWGKKEIFDRRMFEGFVLGPFENMMLPLPLDTDLYLKSLYGDYMTLPPPEDRVPKHRQF